MQELIVHRGHPAVIVSDNGTEMTCRAVLKVGSRCGVAWHHIVRAYVHPG